MVTKKKTAKKTAKKEAVAEVKTPEVEEVKEEVKTEEIPNEEVVTEEISEEKVEPKKATKRAIGTIKWWKKVYQGIGTIKTQYLRWPISKALLPQDIQRWLTNKGYGTNVYLKDKEWLEKHNVDMTMVEKLKKFISDNYL